MSTIEISCVEVWREISNYLDGEISVELRERMRAHFEVCEHCTAVLDGTRNIVQLVGDGRIFRMPDGFSERLVQEDSRAPLAVSCLRRNRVGLERIRNILVIHVHPQFPVPLRILPPDIHVAVSAINRRTSSLGRRASIRAIRSHRRDLL